MVWEGNERRAKSYGRRFVDQALCPFHDGHETILKGLESDMKKKIGLRAGAIFVSALIGVLSISYLAVNRYVESATLTAVGLLKNHIEKSEDQLQEIQQQLARQNSELRLMNYRLNKLDKTPSTPWPNSGGRHDGGT